MNDDATWAGDPPVVIGQGDTAQAWDGGPAMRPARQVPGIDDKIAAHTAQAFDMLDRAMRQSTAVNADRRAAECVAAFKPLADAAVATLQQVRQSVRNAAIQCEAAAKVLDAIIHADEIARIRAKQDADPRYQSGGALVDFRVCEDAGHE